VIGSSQGDEALGLLCGLEDLRRIVYVDGLITRGVEDQERLIQVPNCCLHMGTLKVVQELFLDGEGSAPDGDLGFASGLKGRSGAR
jgi:hypothetical protein